MKQKKTLPRRQCLSLWTAAFSTVDLLGAMLDSGGTRFTRRSLTLVELILPDAAGLWRNSFYQTQLDSGGTRFTRRSWTLAELVLPDAA